MQKVIRFIVRVLGAISPKLAGRFSYYLFFKSFKLKSHPLDLQKKATGTRLDFVVAGKRTSTWYWGKGPVIVLVHGWGSKGFHYRKFIDPLVRNGFTVVIPDMPGHVSSDGKTTNVLEFKQTLTQIFEHFGEVYGLMGHSLGALACILLLNENEHKVEKFVMANSAAYADSTMNRFMEVIGGNHKVKQALLDRLKSEFNEDFDYYSSYYLIQEVEDLPSMFVIGDRDDAEVGIDEIKAFAKLTDAIILETQGMGHNNGLKTDNVVSEVVEFFGIKKPDESPVQ